MGEKGLRKEVVKRASIRFIIYAGKNLEIFTHFRNSIGGRKEDNGEFTMSTI